MWSAGGGATGVGDSGLVEWTYGISGEEGGSDAHDPRVVSVARVRVRSAGGVDEQLGASSTDPHGRHRLLRISLACRLAGTQRGPFLPEPLHAAPSGPLPRAQLSERPVRLGARTRRPPWHAVPPVCRPSQITPLAIVVLGSVRRSSPAVKLALLPCEPRVAGHGEQHRLACPVIGRALATVARAGRTFARSGGRPTEEGWAATAEAPPYIGKQVRMEAPVR